VRAGDGGLYACGRLGICLRVVVLVNCRPYRGLVLSAIFSVGAVWIGLTLSYEFPTLPPSSMIIAAAVGIYTLALLATAAHDPRSARLRLAGLYGPPGHAHDHA